jgi:hypothetical protein
MDRFVSVGQWVAHLNMNSEAPEFIILLGLNQGILPKKAVLNTPRFDLLEDITYANHVHVKSGIGRIF